MIMITILAIITLPHAALRAEGPARGPNLGTAELKH